MAAVDRLSKLADMVIWVLDPQKYADAAVHNRYLIPLAGHAGVFTVVLNQIDTLPPEQAKDCENDLRRLLDAEGLADTPVLPVSARTGAGLGDLRALLIDTVNASHAASERIAADIDSVVGGFAATPAGRSRRTRRSPRWPGRARQGAPMSRKPAQSRPPWEIGDERARGAPTQKPPWEDAKPHGAGRARRPCRQRA